MPRKHAVPPVSRWSGKDYIHSPTQVVLTFSMTIFRILRGFGLKFDI